MKKQNRTQPQFTGKYYEDSSDPEMTIIHRVIKAVIFIVLLFGSITAMLLW